MHLMPASSMKLLTSYAALKILGPEFRIKTSISKKGKDFYIKFAGDPEFNRKSLKKVLNIIKTQMSEIDNIFIDDSLFDHNLLSEQWLIGDRRFAFSAPVSPLIFEKNAFKVRVLYDGSKTQIKLLKHNIRDMVNVRNNIDIEHNTNSSCEMELSSDNENNYTVYGCYKIGAKNPERLYIAVQNPKKYMQQWIQKLCKEQDIKYHKVQFGITPKDATVISSISSRPLKKLLRPILLESDNLVTDIILKHISLKKY